MPRLSLVLAAALLSPLPALAQTCPAPLADAHKLVLVTARGTPFADRVRKSSEVMRALKTIWTDDAPSFAGEFVNFPALYSNPKPLQPIFVDDRRLGLRNGIADDFGVDHGA